MGSRGPKPGDAGYRPPRPVLEKILARVIEQDGCLVWQGHLDRKGYGQIRHGSRLEGVKSLRVHRAVYEALVGPIPDEMTIDHLCENKACVNVEHLEVVTNAENKKRGGDRMTSCRKGHPRIPANVYVNPKTGRRVCRVCRGW